MLSGYVEIIIKNYIVGDYMNSSDIIKSIKQTQPKCDECGEVISFAALANGRAVYYMVTPDSKYTNETWETMCRKCLNAKIN